MARISKSELEARNRAGRLCLVREGRVFDVTEFARRHPGGLKPLKNNAGRDVTSLMTRINPHRHSSNAYKLMETFCVGDYEVQVQTTKNTCESANGQPSTGKQYNGQATGADSSLVKDPVDYDKAVLWQAIALGENYYEWAHEPVSRVTMRLFRYDFFEFFSTASWYAVPITWIPLIVTLSWLALQQWQDVGMFGSVLDGAFRLYVPYQFFPLVYVVGIFMWTLLEYFLHRFLFHMEPPSNNKFLIGLHFVLHGVHHKVPFHPGRLVFPPVPALVVVIPYFSMLIMAFPTPIAYTLMAGTTSGYICYDLTHYYLHHGSPAPGSYLQEMKTYHVKHHYEIHDKGFGISTTLWDKLFGTLIPNVKED